jgi:hypothetical protein
MGFDPTCFAGVITSGEVTHRHLSARPDAWWQGLGRCCMHLTWSARGAISLEGLGLDVTTDPHQAREAENARCSPTLQQLACSAMRHLPLPVCG